MKDLNCDKMILAIFQDDQYDDVVSDLNSHGFYATILHSTGGFLKKRSVTVMTCVNHEHLDEVMALMKKYGERVEQLVSPVFGGTDPATDTPTTIQVPARCGGVVLFVLDVDQSIRF
ncbi:MAG: cyclic-di-AMP receptor [Firmicutes bacterium]|nr:cyclic-di-AMP receptor [Bacillota bacterium]